MTLAEPTTPARPARANAARALRTYSERSFISDPFLGFVTTVTVVSCPHAGGETVTFRLRDGPFGRVVRTGGSPPVIRPRRRRRRVPRPLRASAPPRRP